MLGRPPLPDVEKINYRITRRRADREMAPGHYFHLFTSGFPNKLVSLFMIIVLLNQKWDNQGGSHLYIHICDLHLI